MKDGFLDIKSPNWLGGVNVHNTLALIGIGFLVFKAWKKQYNLKLKKLSLTQKVRFFYAINQGTLKIFPP